MKLAEMLFVLFWVVVAAVMAVLVLPHSEIVLQDIALLKVFFLALINLAAGLFILCLRGFKQDVLGLILTSPVALAVFLGQYVLAMAWVLGK